VLVVDEGSLNGRWMLSMVLSFPAANGDPAMFANAGRVVIDRSPNRHAAFGLGIHRCLGSNLARGSRKSLTSRRPRMGWLNGRPTGCADRAPCRSNLAQIDGFQVPRPPPGCEALLQPTHAAASCCPWAANGRSAISAAVTLAIGASCALVAAAVFFI
jgi:hypothetical protein